MMMGSLHFLSGDYTWLQLALLLLGSAIALLLASAISRMAYFTHKTYLLTKDMHRDLRKLVMLKMRQEQLTPTPDRQDEASSDDPA